MRCRPFPPGGSTVARLALAGLAASLLGGCAAPRAAAVPQPPPAPPPPTARAAAPDVPRPDPTEVRALEKAARDLLVKHLPDPLVVSDQNWGRQKEVTVGGRLRGSPVKEPRNDGTWRRFTVRAPNPQAVAVGITEASYPEPGKTALTVMVGLDVDFTVEQQVWRHGVRLYSGETRGRCRAALALKVEVTTRTEKAPGTVFPDVVLRARATDAQLFYDNLVVEHTAGVGGDAARVLGDAALHVVRQARPDLERDLLAKANAAVVKAADTRDVRLSFEALLAGKVPAGLRPK